MDGGVTFLAFGGSLTAFTTLVTESPTARMVGGMPDTMMYVNTSGRITHRSRNMRNLLIAFIFMVGIISHGCVNENTGTSTVVGEQMALPEITDSADSIAVRVYETIKGARVWTAKDSRVTVEYENSYTNAYFGIVETQDSMRLKVKVEPCETGGNDAR